MNQTARQETKPRFRQTARSLLNSGVYSEFLKKYPEHSAHTQELFEKIVNTYNGMIQDVIINERDGIELPEGLGYIFVGSCKPTIKENVDISKSKQVGKKIFNRNLGTDGYVCKIFYTNYESKFKFTHRALWKFKGVRQLTRNLSKVYREDWPKYVIVEEYMKISTLVRKYQQDERRRKITKNNQVTDKYKEFDID
jgi:hypothetical protein